MAKCDNECRRCGRKCVHELCGRCRSRRKPTHVKRAHHRKGYMDLGFSLIERRGVVLQSKAEGLAEIDAERARREVIYMKYVERHGRLDMQAALAEAEAAGRKEATDVPAA